MARSSGRTQQPKPKAGRKVRADTLYGTLNLLILQTLAAGAKHGLDVLRRIEATGSNLLRVEEGALYPALHRLERDGLIEGDWGVSDRGRRARFYRLTAAGEEMLGAETERWRDHAAAVAAVLGVSVEPLAGESES